MVRTTQAAGRDRPATARVRLVLFGLALALVALTGSAALAYATPPNVFSRVGGVVTVPADRVPPPGGDPVYVRDGRFWLVNVLPGEGIPAAAGDRTALEPGGVYALSQGSVEWCTRPVSRWNTSAPLRDAWQVSGVFETICRFSWYGKSGWCFYGPCRRSLDRHPVAVAEDGSLRVDTRVVELRPRLGHPLAASWRPVCPNPAITALYGCPQPPRPW
jgi:hypothetical protein